MEVVSGQAKSQSPIIIVGGAFVNEVDGAMDCFVFFRRNTEAENCACFIIL